MALSILTDFLYKNVNTTKPTVTDFNRYIVNITDMFLLIASAAAIAAIAYSGVIYMTSAGDPGKQKKALAALKYALIGVALIIGAKLILSLVVNFAYNTF